MVPDHPPLFVCSAAMSRSCLALLLATVALSFALRCPFLNERPMHNDEAVNAVKFGALWQEGAYKYDPNEHHGPTLYYAAWLVGKVTGGPDFAHYSENRLRFVCVLFGVGLICLLPLVKDGIGSCAVGWAALFLAVSPAFVFYSRYFIHEILLVFFTLLTLGAGWRYWRSRKLVWILIAGAGLGLMDATKETFAFSVIAAGLALFINQIWNRLIDASGEPVRAPKLNWRHLAAGAGAWLVVAFVVFSSFFTNLSGPIDSLRSYLPWAHRAAGASPHVHPWYFYLHRLLFFHSGTGPTWTEALLLVLAVLGAIAGFRRQLLGKANASFIRFLALYTFVLTGFYSFIGYKTPWCLLNFWLTTALLAGVGSVVLLEKAHARVRRFVVRCILLLGAAHLAWQAWQSDTEYAADPRNPYVYAQTSSDILDLVSAVENVARVSPEGRDTVIQVMAPEDDYWPLPWYLRNLTHVGWWNTVPENPYAPIIIISPRLQKPLDEKRAHLMGFYGLRPNVRLALFVEPSLWERWVAAQKKP